MHKQSKNDAALVFFLSRIISTTLPRLLVSCLQASEKGKRDRSFEHAICAKRVERFPLEVIGWRGEGKNLHRRHATLASRLSPFLSHSLSISIYTCACSTIVRLVSLTARSGRILPAERFALLVSLRVRLVSSHLVSSSFCQSKGGK